MTSIPVKISPEEQHLKVSQGGFGGAGIGLWRLRGSSPHLKAATGRAILPRAWIYRPKVDKVFLKI